MQAAKGTIDLHTMDAQTINAHKIDALVHVEAGEIARVELTRFLDLVEQLTGDDWEQPTDCTEWTVGDILAHQAGAYAGFAGWAEFRRQAQAKPGPDQMQVDAMNAMQIADRAGRTKAELISELRTVGPKGIRTRQRLPWLLRKLPVPFGPPLGTKPVEYLTDLIYTRDTWSHRLDICRAVGREFVPDAAHDGRMVALVMREMAQQLQGTLGGQSVIFQIMGPAGGRYRIGSAADPSAIIRMELETFIRLTSERLTPREALENNQVAISGDRTFAADVLDRCPVPY